MNTLDEIEAAVSQLTLEERVRFRQWFVEFEAQQWDEQIEQDIDTGKLDHLAEQALEHQGLGQATNRST